MVASKIGSPHHIRLLIDLGAIIDLRDKDGLS